MAVEALERRVSELIKDVNLELSPSFTKLVDNTVSSIKNIINLIPEDFQVTADKAPGFVRDVGADKVDFKFKKPKLFEVGGSYSIGGVVKPDVNVNLLMRLPKYLQSSALISKVESLEVSNLPGFSVKIIPMATSLFSIPKLNATRNNVRALNQEGVPLPTPKYNFSILEDMFIEEFAEVLKGTFHGWDELRKALVLIKVWARQRSSMYSHDCLNGYLIAVIMSYLAANKGGGYINKSMNAMQIFRVTLDFIGS
ncbi:Nucleolar protein 6 [Bienertia sinuspersici]